jgi:hypothetical protein
MAMVVAVNGQLEPIIKDSLLLVKGGKMPEKLKSRKINIETGKTSGSKEAILGGGNKRKNKAA